MLRTARPEVVDSWRRSAAAGVDVDSQESPVTLPTDTLSDYRRSHRLSSVYPLLEEVLGQAARACDALLALSDEAGQLLWVSGSPATLRKAETIGFVEGSNWDERVAGTNAPGTALALDRPVVVTGEEHFRLSVKPWNCAACPIHDPGSGSLLGVLDITGGSDVAVPQTIAMVRAAARLAETELARQSMGRGPAGMPGGDQEQVWLSGLSPDSFHLQVLGRREGVLRRGSGPSRSAPGIPRSWFCSQEPAAASAARSWLCCSIPKTSPARRCGPSSTGSGTWWARTSWVRAPTGCTRVWRVTGMPCRPSWPRVTWVRRCATTSGRCCRTRRPRGSRRCAARSRRSCARPCWTVAGST